MLIRQSKNSYIRCTERYGYITNQLTQHDRSYNETGADLLRQITREPRDVNDIVKEIKHIYQDVSESQLREDFLEFANSLARDYFVVIGESVEELDEKRSRAHV